MWVFDVFGQYMKTTSFFNKKGEKLFSPYNTSTPLLVRAILQWYAPVKIIGIKIIVPIKSGKSLRLMVHISKTLTKSLR
jgi:hypothetical protein